MCENSPRSEKSLKWLKNDWALYDVNLMSGPKSVPSSEKWIRAIRETKMHFAEEINSPTRRNAQD